MIPNIAPTYRVLTMKFKQYNPLQAFSHILTGHYCCFHPVQLFFIRNYERAEQQFPIVGKIQQTIFYGFNYGSWSNRRAGKLIKHTTIPFNAPVFGVRIF